MWVIGAARVSVLIATDDVRMNQNTLSVEMPDPLRTFVDERVRGVITPMKVNIFATWFDVIVRHSRPRDCVS